MSAPFSLHCTICFEAFDQTARPPVVLPCGHTYLCQPCSLRLEKCMECRTPLFRIIAPSKPEHSGAQPQFSPKLATDRTYAAQSHSLSLQGLSSSPIAHPVIHRQVVRERLPIPKNVVLMALLQSPQIEDKRQGEDEKGYESGDDDDDVRQGIQQMKSNFGTYVVRDPRGLEILAELPPGDDLTNKENEDQSLNGDTRCNEDDEPVKASEDVNSVLELEPSVETKQSESAKGILQYGQTVQVARYDGRTAKLPRGRGYLKAASHQLVKVGNAKDEACRVEGMIASLSLQKEETVHQLQEMDGRISALNDKLRKAREVPFEEPFQVSSVLFKDSLDEQDDFREKGPGALDTVSPTTPSHLCHTEVGTHGRQQNLSLPSLGTFPIGSEHQLTLFSHHQISPSRSFGVDFRTGMSGHSALTSSRSRNEYRREIRMRGEHRGIGKIEIGPIRRMVSQFLEGTKSP